MRSYITQSACSLRLYVVNDMIHKHNQQVEKRDPSSLFCFCETSSGVPHSVLGPSAEEKHGPVRAGPEESHKDDKVEASLYEKKELVKSREV